MKSLTSYLVTEKIHQQYLQQLDYPQPAILLQAECSSQLLTVYNKSYLSKISLAKTFFTPDMAGRLKMKKQSKQALYFFLKGQGQKVEMIERMFRTCPK